MHRLLNILLCVAVVALVGLGLVMLASTSAWVRGEEREYFFLQRQAVMAGIGVLVAFGVAMMNPERLRKFWPWLLAGGCVLLALCFVPGVSADINGERRWINVPIIQRFQPSEVAKVVTMIALAGWFSRWRTEARTLFHGFLVPSVLLGIPFALIFLETDMGTALGLGLAGFGVLYAAGTRLSYMIPSAILAVIAGFRAILMNPNRWSRIEAWMNMEDPRHQLDKAMQQWHALLAFGNGGTTGQGLGNGFEKFGRMPYAHTDFIFPNIGEELGLWGTLGTVACYVLIAVAGTGIAAYATNTFNRCLAIGLTGILVVPAMVNIGVTTAVLPNTGLPLPFVSYGGTNLIFALITVGLLCGIHRRSRVELRQEPLIKSFQPRDLCA